MKWSGKYKGTWEDVLRNYQRAKADHNFIPNPELDRMMDRINGDQIEDMDVDALENLWKAATALQTELENSRRLLGEEWEGMIGDVYKDLKEELKEVPGGYKGSFIDSLFNMEQLTAVNVLRRMSGWNPNGVMTKVAEMLEKGERDVRAYKVKAARIMESFLNEHQDWVKKADGQGKNAIWYTHEVPELLKRGEGDKPIFGETITVYMTPVQKAHLYLESKNADNLWHMEKGGRTFVNKALYSKGKRQEAFAQGTTIKLAPETVKQLVADLTPEEMALAQVLEHYYNAFSKGKINKTSNVVVGYDRAMESYYAPIFTNENYTKSEYGIYDLTAEGVGHMKERVKWAGTPTYNISALDAFERHVDQTARYCGMAIPARNLKMLMNWREGDVSAADLISHKWGDEGKKYITSTSHIWPRVETAQPKKSCQRWSVCLCTNN